MISRRSLFAVLAASVVAALALSAVCCAQDAKPWEQPGATTGQEIIGPDGGKMVWVPAGEFTMGSAEGEGESGEHPAHRVRITKGFWLGKCTVTLGQWKSYCQAAGVDVGEAQAPADNHPVVCVNWTEAVAYCRRYGLSLPTEAQWEYAARGPRNCTWPWGNTWDLKKCCNAENQGPGGKTFPVGSFPEGASWCGALDMAGNVFQWCKDWYSGGYDANAPDADPPGPAEGATHEVVVRGGAWFDFIPTNFRCAARASAVPSGRYNGLGFRCVRSF
jgi:formylglycine-generating enzyme required for sulfatase activity